MSSIKIPLIDVELVEVKNFIWNKLLERKSQCRLVLVIVSMSFFLDNFLYMEIVLIMPDHSNAREIEIVLDSTEILSQHEQNSTANTFMIFASKSIVQLLIIPFSGILIDKFGYDKSMMIGICLMLFSYFIFTCGINTGTIYFARIPQGIGSAIANTSGLAMIADRFTEKTERYKAFGIVLIFMSFGNIIMPLFCNNIQYYTGESTLHLILTLMCLIDGLILLLLMKIAKEQLRKSEHHNQFQTVPIWRLLIDPYIAICAGALLVSNVAVGFLMPLSMQHPFTEQPRMAGLLWLPALLPCILAIFIAIKISKKYPQYQWLIAAFGLFLEGLCCFLMPYANHHKQFVIFICGIYVGLALINTILLPTFGHLVDVRYIPVYGNIYAIVNIFYSFSFIVGPIITYPIVMAIDAINFCLCIGLLNIFYLPFLYYLRNIYEL